MGRKNRKKPSYTTPSSSYSDFSASDSGRNSESKNISAQSFTGNPNEYTIGGVLSSMDVEHYFIQILSVSAFLLHTSNFKICTIRIFLGGHKMLKMSHLF